MQPPPFPTETEGKVGVFDQGSSQKQIRVMAMQVLQPDGTTATVYLQVVTLADADGNEIDFATNRNVMAKLDELIDKIDELIMQLKFDS